MSLLVIKTFSLPSDLFSHEFIFLDLLGPHKFNFNDIEAQIGPAQISLAQENRWANYYGPKLGHSFVV